MDLPLARGSFTWSRLPHFLTIEEFRTFFFYSLISWTAAFLTPLVISFHDFLVLFSSPP
jgi:hypothetical protein